MLVLTRNGLLSYNHLLLPSTIFSSRNPPTPVTSIFRNQSIDCSPSIPLATAKPPYPAKPTCKSSKTDATSIAVDCVPLSKTCEDVVPYPIAKSPINSRDSTRCMPSKRM